MRTHPSFRCVITNRNKLLFVLEIDISVFYLKNFKCEYILDRYLQIINIMHELYSYSWDVFVLGEYVPCVLVTQSSETLCDPRLLCPWNSPGLMYHVGEGKLYSGSWFAIYEEYLLSTIPKKE